MSPKQRDTGLSNRQIEEFKARLENWQTQLRANASQITKEGREIINDSALDVADRALNSSTKEFLFMQAQQRNRLLQDVGKALKRIREGTFGECTACGGPISSKRLEVIPWTRYCVVCQEKLERGELADSEEADGLSHFSGVGKRAGMERPEMRVA